MSDQDQAVDKIAEVIKMVIRGWPIYGVVVGLLWSYGEFWLDDKIDKAIRVKTLEQPAVVTLTNSVQNNTQAINRVSEQVEIVEEDTKTILKIMAGED
jgi:hypothetical protein